MKLPRIFGRRSAALIAELEAQVAHLEEQLNIVQTARIASARDYANATQAFRNVQLELESDIESAAAKIFTLESDLMVEQQRVWNFQIALRSIAEDPANVTNGTAKRFQRKVRVAIEADLKLVKHVTGEDSH